MGEHAVGEFLCHLVESCRVEVVGRNQRKDGRTGVDCPIHVANVNFAERRLAHTKQERTFFFQANVGGAFDEIAEKNPNANPLEILQRAVDNVRPRLEVKARRVGGATYQVPLEVPGDRQLSLAMRWLVDLADARKGIPMREALAAEIMDAYQGQGNAIRKRDEVHKMAQANKAFAHFRW